MSLKKQSTSGESEPALRKREVLHHQSRNIIYNVYSFFKKLSKREELEQINFSRPQELTAKACGIGSLRTIQRICADTRPFIAEGQTPMFTSPGKRHNMQKRVTHLDDFGKDILRHTIYSFYDRGEFPTAKKLAYEMRQKIDYKGSVSSMYTILKSLGFKYRKTNDARKFLMERGDIVAARLKFLRTMHDLRNSGDERPIFYLGETFVSQNHTKKHIWQCTSGNGGLKVPTSKEERLIVCHVGSAQTGFIPESKWVFRSQPHLRNVGQYSEMDASNFKEWFTNRFLNYLEEGSIIVMDNAKYHSVTINNIPNLASQKNEIQEWLRQKNIDYDPAETKAELLQRVVPYKSTEKVYELDQIAAEMGHQVIRLPPYHCMYNPIQMVWAKIKGEVAEQNETFRLTDVEALVNAAIEHITKEDWSSIVQYVEKLQEEDYEKEVAREEILQPIIIILEEDSDDSDVIRSEDEEDDYEDED